MYYTSQIFRFILFVLLVVFLFQMRVLYASDDSGKNSTTALSVVNTYRSSENAIIRKNALKKLSVITFVQTDQLGPQWKRNLLKEALYDKNPIVVEEVICQIGELNIHDLNPLLIQLFSTSEVRFRGYSGRIQIAILRTFGRIGDEEVKKLLVDFLTNDKGSFLAGKVLLTIKELNDPSLVEIVQEYSQKMDAKVAKLKAQNVDPMQYSMFLMHSELAKDIVKSFLSKEGGAE